MTYTSRAAKRPPLYLGAHRRQDFSTRIITAAGAIVLGLSVCLVGGCGALVGA